MGEGGGEGEDGGVIPGGEWEGADASRWEGQGKGAWLGGWGRWGLKGTEERVNMERKGMDK